MVICFKIENDFLVLIGPEEDEYQTITKTCCSPEISSVMTSCFYTTMTVLGAHLGQSKTFERIKRRYWWRHMRQRQLKNGSRLVKTVRERKESDEENSNSER